jgi:hypothetical protein
MSTQAAKNLVAGDTVCIWRNADSFKLATVRRSLTFGRVTSARRSTKPGSDLCRVAVADDDSAKIRVVWLKPETRVCIPRPIDRVDPLGGRMSDPPGDAMPLPGGLGVLEESDGES